jgi:hypothetical protein
MKKKSDGAGRGWLDEWPVDEDGAASSIAARVESMPSAKFVGEGVAATLSVVGEHDPSATVAKRDEMTLGKVFETAYNGFKEKKPTMVVLRQMYADLSTWAQGISAKVSKFFDNLGKKIEATAAYKGVMPHVEKAQRVADAGIDATLRADARNLGEKARNPTFAAMKAMSREEFPTHRKSGGHTTDL